ncbi:uncharacterized protein LOC114296880 [Camellia sinensis]|uniref:uncharacterized protein LOC114296880 n=1 Tax=Camellia sinensis TaxID=4442 RepID=UPI001036D3A5|nr:uncharacterized protein LOC114296880 [Camellia sinensis]
MSKMTVSDALQYCERTNDHGCSTEEKDHLIQSTKKIKSTTDHKDAVVGETVSLETNNGDLNSNPQSPKIMAEDNESQIGAPVIADNQAIAKVFEVPKSFKQALIRSRFNESVNEKNFDCDVESFSSNKDEPSITDITETEVEAMVEERDSISKVTIPSNLWRKVREPWRKCLIVSLLGKTIGYKLFMAKVKKIWGLQGNFEALVIKHGFFIVKFDMMEDYTKVFTSGPWVALDHYVTVGRWQQDFKSDEAEEDTTAMWVRFPYLPIEYYNEKVLFHIAKVLGTPLKIDINTAMAARGRYAWVCVEMDPRKPLISQIAIGQLKLNIDGSRKSGGNGGFGGLIRNERGAWVCGYYGRL